jgi:hypothetical protein
MKKTSCALILALFALVVASALDLSVDKGDVLIIQSPEGGYHLYIKKKADIASVLLTETTKDPALKESNYAYRAPEWNAINGDEKRLLSGSFIPPEKKLWSLIDSTPEKDTPIGEAFHIWIPYVLQYGYSWSRSGEIEIRDGTFINIRAFAKPYGDYSGSFADNPFKIQVTQKPVARALPPALVAPPPAPEPPAPQPEPPANVEYMKDTVSSFSSLAELSKGRTLYAKGPDDIVPLIRSVLVPPGNKSLDLTFVIDATESMTDDIDKVRKMIIPEIENCLSGYPAWRLSLVLYKDYDEDFLVKRACIFTEDLATFKKALWSFRVQGGRDIPEAVYEGINDALSLPWNLDADRKIILIGDAPPHPKPRGKVTKESVEAAAQELGVQVNVIILPHGETY